MTMTKIDPEVKTKWLAALRSGKYSQTKEVLRDTYGFCCLGVLCDILNPSGWRNISYGAFAYEANIEVPSDEIMDILGGNIGHTNLDIPEVEINGMCKSVAAHNDDGVTFAEIADAIEEQL